MKHPSLMWSVVVLAAVFAATVATAASSSAQAQVPGAPGIAELAKKPTPRLANGRPDLNGTWKFEGGISFVRPQTLPDGSICVLGCPPAPGGGERGGGGGNPLGAQRARDFPK